MSDQGPPCFSEGTPAEETPARGGATQPGQRHTARTRRSDLGRLRFYRNPLRLVVSRSPWNSAWYLLAYLFTGTALFAVAFTVATFGAVLAITWIGIPLLAAAAVVIRGCADVERGRLRAVFPEPVRGGYRTVAKPGIFAQVTTRWKDPATWRDIAYLVGLYIPLLALDCVVLTVWLTLLAGVTLPVWYWAPKNEFGNGVTAHGAQLGYFPNGPHGHGAVGVFVGSLPTALLAAACFLVLFLAFNYVLVATARAQARTARALLRPPADPLAEVRCVLAAPGPLTPLIPNGGRKMRNQAS